jgi:hypothetical protein
MYLFVSKRSLWVTPDIAAGSSLYHHKPCPDKQIPSSYKSPNKAKIKNFLAFMLPIYQTAMMRLILK